MRTPLFLGLLGFLLACGDHHSVYELPDVGQVAEHDAGGDVDPTFGDVSVPDVSVDAPSGPINLVPNGDFEQGNTLFGSDYTYASPTNSLEGQYTVGLNGNTFNGFLVSAGDHTSGSTQMFIGNGKATPDRVWLIASINVKAGTDYFFEAFVMNLCCNWSPDVYGPASLSFYANGKLLGTRTSAKLGVWEGLSTTWNSGGASTVDLKLVNANTEAIGNDFAVDDVFLGTESIVNPMPK